MKLISTVAPWLLIPIVALPQLSETVYTPALPDIARDLKVQESWVEFTLTIYLIGFAIGTLFWGKLSDKFGRRRCLLAGLLVYVLGCVGCLCASSIYWLLFSRLIQAFGGSTGSVLGQAICRDSFQGKRLSQVYAQVGAVLAFSPAVGPVVGGLIDQAYGWPAIFIALILLGTAVWVLTFFRLPETHVFTTAPKILMWDTAKTLLSDRQVLVFGFLVAGCNGIPFSYYAEGSFYLIEILGLTPAIYGSSFLGIAVFGALGSFISSRMHRTREAESIIAYGIKTILAAMTFFTGMTLLFTGIAVGPGWSIALTLSSMMLSSLGIGIAVPNVLALSLRHYRHAIGTASAVFGCFYYSLISLFTAGMALFHNHTLLPMPLYFLGIASCMSFVWWVAKRGPQEQVSEEKLANISAAS